ncbi:MAG: flagellar basal body rod protein FlgC [Ignavibacteria bacterium]|nr:MAG: flagellar basal body rod protein FlgC [Ignavibacteria bacterium]
MKIGDTNYSAFNISAKGLNLQRIKIKLIAENIANSETTNTKEGGPYKRKFLRIGEIKDTGKVGGSIMQSIGMRSTNPNHFQSHLNKYSGGDQVDAKYDVLDDNSKGEFVFMPNHPDADENGYVQLPNVNIINEMVEMITATRSYEANLTALNSAKEIVKDSLEI